MNLTKALREGIRWRTVGMVLTLLAGNLLFFLTIWMANKYDKVTLDQFIYAAKSSAAGANRSLMNSAKVRVGVFGVGAAVLELLLYRRCVEAVRRVKAGRFARFVVRRAVALVVAVLIFAAGLFTVKLNLVQFVGAAATESEFIEDHYVDPTLAKLTFPDEKRNLIYIFLESMENTFAEPEAGGPIYDDFIPELSALAREHVNFSNDDGLGGALSFSGTTWTAAAMVTQTSGINVQVPLDAEYFGGENGYMPGVVSLGEILEDAGYRQTLLVGSDAQFGGRDAYFTEHGNYNIVDMNTLKDRRWLPEDYRVWWGFEDAKLFGNLCNDGSCAGTGTATHTCGDEYHIGTLENCTNIVNGLLGCTCTDLGVSTRAKALGNFFTNDELTGSLGFAQSLTVGVDRYELYAANVGCDHTVDCVVSAAAYADNLNIDATFQGIIMFKCHGFSSSELLQIIILGFVPFNEGTNLHSI